MPWTLRSPRRKLTLASLPAAPEQDDRTPAALTLGGFAFVALLIAEFGALFAAEGIAIPALLLAVAAMAAADFLLPHPGP